MDKAEKIMAIKAMFDRYRKQADRIMDGGDNYDGADGARAVLELCDLADELVLLLNG